MIRQTLLLIAAISLVACGGGSTDAPPAADSNPTESQASGTISQPGAGAVAYTGAAIWDGTGSAMQRGMTLVVRAGRIEGIVAGRHLVDLVHESLEVR